MTPPAKSVSLSSWNIAAIKKKISWITRIVIPEIAKWSVSRMLTAIIKQVCVLCCFYSRKILSLTIFSSFKFTAFHDKRKFSFFTVYFHAIFHGSRKREWENNVYIAKVASRFFFYRINNVCKLCTQIFLLALHSCHTATVCNFSFLSFHYRVGFQNQINSTKFTKNHVKLVLYYVNPSERFINDDFKLIFHQFEAI